MKNPNISRREAVCQWLTANGINPNDVPEDGDLYIADRDGTRVIRYEVFVRDADGNLMRDERGADLAVDRREAPLVVEPPDWWQPFEKPTREQLQVVLAQVREIAERYLHDSDDGTDPCAAGVLAALNPQEQP